MKQAKDEAEKEMEVYRSRLEEEYQTQISGVNQHRNKKKLPTKLDVVLILYLLFSDGTRGSCKTFRRGDRWQDPEP